ncbi:hypothetical protein K5549_020286, partial [Capra hircus]|uniref:Uncharacterized protein n=1 Tax=Capra hircus TaxID=9925 RepID=A0A452GB95_CAPHI
KSFQILTSKATRRGTLRMAPRLCQGFLLSVKAPACETPSHFTLHVRQQTKSTNGVN